MPKSTDASSKKAKLELPEAKSYTNKSVQAVCILYAAQEIKKADELKKSQIHALMQQKFPAHVDLFLSGAPPLYDHPELARLRKAFLFSKDKICLKSGDKIYDGKSLWEKSLAIWRELRNTTLPEFRQCRESLTEDLKLKSGKTVDDLVLELKRRLWLHQSKAEAKFKGNKAYNEFGSAFLSFLVAGPINAYLAPSRDVVVEFTYTGAPGESHKQPSGSGRQATRDLKRAASQAGSQASVAASILKTEQTKSTVTLLQLLVNSGSAEQKAFALQQAQTMVLSSMTETMPAAAAASPIASPSPGLSMSTSPVAFQTDDDEEIAEITGVTSGDQDDEPPAENDDDEEFNG